jgi:hypothetical protein
MIAMFMKSIFLFCCLIFSFSAFGETPEVYDSQYEELHFKQIFTELPSTLLKSSDVIFQKEKTPIWVGVLGSTILLYEYDEDILRECENFGNAIGIGNKDGTKTVLSYNNFPILRLPSDAGSAMYFLGDGWTHMTIAWSFYLYGLSEKKRKPTNVGIQLMHGMAASTLVNQVMKRSFGRESPNTRTEFRGRWRPGPSVKAYWEKTAEFDAMPSGHIMTATLVFTVLNNNYPEESYWLRPTEYVWLTLLGYEMVNNGVHWASDYPIGIATGLVIGNIVSNLGATNGVTNSDSKPKDQSLLVFPMQDGDITSINALMTF